MLPGGLREVRRQRQQVRRAWGAGEKAEGVPRPEKLARETCRRGADRRPGVMGGRRAKDGRMRCASCGQENRAGARFCDGCGTRLSGEVTVEATGEAERRQLTAMFCDLVDSTALSERLDAEELRDVVRAYQQVAVGGIEPCAG